MSDEKRGNPGEFPDERTPAPIRAMRVIALSRNESPGSRPGDAPLPTFEDASSPHWSPAETEPVTPQVAEEPGGRPSSYQPPPRSTDRSPSEQAPPDASARRSSYQPPSEPPPRSPSYRPPGATPAPGPSYPPSPLASQEPGYWKGTPDSPLPSFADELADELTPVYVNPGAAQAQRSPSDPSPPARSVPPAAPIEVIHELFADDAEESDPKPSPVPSLPEDFEPISTRDHEELDAELEDVEPTPIAPSYELRGERPPAAAPGAREVVRSVPPAAPQASGSSPSSSGPQDRPPPPKRTGPQGTPQASVQQGGLAPPQGAGRPALPTAKMKKKPWWEEVFGDDFSRSYRGPSRTQLESEVSFIERALSVARGSVVLDLGCGQGEYAVELGRRGYSVVGYDLSVFQLAMAADRAQTASQKINFLQGDMREMAFDSMFDAIVSWNTSFGYFEEDRNADVLRRMYSALRPGGVLLLEVLNRDYAAREAPISNWYEGDGCICMDDMTLDFITSRLTVKRSVILDDGRSKEVVYSVRLYCLSEIGKLLHDVGFQVQSVSGSTSTPGAFLGSNSPSIIIRAERPAAHPTAQ